MKGTTMKRHTVREIAQAALKIADKHPDYVYESPEGDRCFYLYDGKPSCLFGRAVVKVYGKKVKPLLSACERLNIEEVVRTLREAGLIEGGVDRPLIEEMGRAQSSQDCGLSWAAAAVILREALVADESR